MFVRPHPPLPRSLSTPSTNLITTHQSITHKYDKAIYDALSGDRFAAVQSALGSPTDVDIAAAGVEGASELTNGLKSWMGVFREAQAFEVSKCHTEWLRAAKPALGPGIKERFEWAATITRERHAAAEAARQRCVLL